MSHQQFLMFAGWRDRCRAFCHWVLGTLQLCIEVHTLFSSHISLIAHRSGMIFHDGRWRYEKSLVLALVLQGAFVGAQVPHCPFSQNQSILIGPSLSIETQPLCLRANKRLCKR
jgi:hypothetical protein